MASQLSCEKSMETKSLCKQGRPRLHQPKYLILGTRLKLLKMSTLPSFLLQWVLVDTNTRSSVLEGGGGRGIHSECTCHTQIQTTQTQMNVKNAHTHTHTFMLGQHCLSILAQVRAGLKINPNQLLRAWVAQQLKKSHCCLHCPPKPTNKSSGKIIHQYIWSGFVGGWAEMIMMFSIGWQIIQNDAIQCLAQGHFYVTVGSSLLLKCNERHHHPTHRTMVSLYSMQLTVVFVSLLKFWVKWEALANWMKCLNLSDEVFFYVS